MSAQTTLDQVDINTLIDLVAIIESEGNTMAVGDNGKAFGILQIQQPTVDDFNNWNGTNYRARDMLGNEKLSRKVFKDYIKNYATEMRIGRKPTVIDAVRIWNGGPNGYKKNNTLKYLYKFISIANKNNFHV